MNQKTDTQASSSQTLWSTVFAICYGLVILGFLVAIERVNWAHIKPATGTAAALHYASDRPSQNASDSSDQSADTGHRKS